MDKILSIIIPTYNMENYLRKCLDSLIVGCENMQLLEVLVVNDGSKDSSSIIGHEYETKFPETFKVIDKENGNYGSCINRGIKEATGKYVKVLDADDYFDTQVFCNYISLLSKIDTDMIITDYSMVDESGNSIKDISFESSIPVCAQEIDFQNFLSNNYNGKYVFEMHAITYKRGMLIKMNYQQTEGISYTDQEWSTIPITQVGKFYYFHINLYRYLLGRAGQTMHELHNPTHMNQLFKVILFLSALYENRSYEEPYDYYINRKIAIQLKYNLYYSLLKKTEIDNSTLLEYDSTLKKYKRAYELANDFTSLMGRVHYVKIWRSNNFFKTLLFVYFPKLLRRSNAEYK